MVLLHASHGLISFNSQISRLWPLRSSDCINCFLIDILCNQLFNPSGLPRLPLAVPVLAPKSFAFAHLLCPFLQGQYLSAFLTFVENYYVLYAFTLLKVELPPLSLQHCFILLGYLAVQKAPLSELRAHPQILFVFSLL